MHRKIIGIGEVLWDQFPTGDILGGAPANFAYHSAQLGFTSCIISVVGNDDLGRKLLKQLSKKNCDYHIQQVPAPTGTAKVSYLPDNTPHYTITNNVAWDYLEFTHSLTKIAKQCEAVCFGTLAQRSELSRATIHQFLNAVPTGTLKIYDMNLREPYYNEAIITASLEQCSILKLNTSELQTLTTLFALNKTTEEALIQKLIDDYALKMVIVTKGTHGSTIFTPETASVLEAPKVDVIDTVGAGDSFTASFISAYLAGKSIPEAHQFASDVSAYICTQAGAMPELPMRFKEFLRPETEKRKIG